ncbi:hypothetical protein GE061_019015 [Apolygus lucorum]|uniref:Uncharacterized protein n=1 Tax=Apolygus lucorum TaxID=248454 RepID=A0A6A4JXD5_APOLU|nr:hypothetical protein GE061_019015 [Apolygus lucorum]
MKFLKKVFGPRCYLCYMLLSVWATIQMTSMGAFFWVHAVGLLEDVGLHEEHGSAHEFYEAADEGYRKRAYNCFICAGLYVVTFVVCCFLFFRKSRSHVKSGHSMEAVEGNKA